MAVFLRLAHRSHRVGRLARLADRDDHLVFGRKGLAVAVFAGDLGLHRNARQALDEGFAHHARVVGGAARHNGELAQQDRLLAGERHTVAPQGEGVGIDIMPQGVRNRAGLLKNFLEHEVVEPFLLSGIHIPADLLNLLLNGAAVRREEGDAVGGDLRDLMVVGQVDLAGIAQQRRHIACDVVGALPAADHQRVVAAHAPQGVRLACAGDHQRIGAAQHGQHLPQGGAHVSPVAKAEQLRHHLGVGLAAELDPLVDQLAFKFGKVFNDAVVHYSDSARHIGVRMGIDLIGFAVGGPTGVADAGTAPHGILGELRAQVGEPAGRLAHLEPVLAEHGDARGVIAAVFLGFQAAEQHLDTICSSGKPDNSTHKMIPRSKMMSLLLLAGSIPPETGLVGRAQVM